MCVLCVWGWGTFKPAFIIQANAEQEEKRRRRGDMSKKSLKVESRKIEFESMDSKSHFGLTAMYSVCSYVPFHLVYTTTWDTDITIVRI